MWVARDEDGELFLFEEKPHKNSISWSNSGFYELFALDENILPEVKWEDEEPTEVELIIKKK